MQIRIAVACALTAVFVGCGDRKVATTQSTSSQEATELRIKKIDADASLSAEEKQRRKDIVERRTKADRSVAKNPDQR